MTDDGCRSIAEIPLWRERIAYADRLSPMVIPGGGSCFFQLRVEEGETQKQESDEKEKYGSGCFVKDGKVV